MKQSVKRLMALVVGLGSVGVLLFAAQEPIEDLRVPVEYWPDGTLKAELFAAHAFVQPDQTITASGIVFRVFSTNAVQEMVITAEDAVCRPDREAVSSKTAVSVQRGDVLLTGTGFEWNGTNMTLRILQNVRVSLPSELIKPERIVKREK
ncbi:MAG TPA: LPS export ABC transporter periplasmic protein LptC [Verrucomicrobia bacterium]|nr:LPS export ABC transporter periplasmic protein LptC [Verrucomicrobiota bacterium]